MCAASTRAPSSSAVDLLTPPRCPSEQGQGHGRRDEAVPCWEDTGDGVRLGYLQFVAPESCLLGKGTPGEAALEGYCTAEAERGSEEGRPGFLSCTGQWRSRQLPSEELAAAPPSPRTSTEHLRAGGQSGQPAGRGDRTLRT